MSDTFVDPVRALAAREQQALGGVVTAEGVTRDVKHASTMRVWIDKARAIVLPTVTSYTFTQADLDAIHEAHELSIVDKASSESGWRVRRALGETRRGVKGYYETLRKPFRAVAEAIIDLQDRDGQPIAEAEAVLGDKLIAYDKVTKAAEEQERQRLQAIADAEAQAARDATAAAMAQVAAAETDPAVQDALRREAAGIASVPVVGATVRIASARGKVRNTGITEQHTGELLSKTEFIKAVAAGRIPLEAVEINQSWIDGKARELKEQLGVVFTFLKYIKHEGTRG